MIASAIEAANERTLGKDVQYVNVCPPCFNFPGEDEDHTIRNTMDSNMKHALLKRHTRWELEIFESKLFIDYARKNFSLAPSAHEQVNTIIPRNACGPKYMATCR